MTKLWDDIAKTIRDGVGTVVEKTEELTKIGKIKVDILNIKRNVDKNFSELGGRVYHLIVEDNKTQISGDKEVKEIIECVKILENELNEKKSELRNIKNKEQVQNESDSPAEASKANTKTKSKSKTAPTKKARSVKPGKVTKS